MRVAVIREIGASLADCELSFVARSPIDVERARRQHHAYAEALASLGCHVQTLPALDGHPDAVFVEDVAVVVDEIAVMTRPGAASRRGEGDSVAAALARFRTIAHLHEPATLDGGDVLRIGHDVLVGESARSNRAGIEQLQALLGPHGYRVRGVAIHGCLHLKSAVTEVAEGVVLVNPDWIDAKQLDGLRIIEIDAAEPHAANALRIGASVIYPDCFPRTQALIEALGVAVVTVDVSELQKAEGAVTCCSLVFRDVAVGRGIGST